MIRRYPWPLLSLGLLICLLVGVALINKGVYGWTLFLTVPFTLGALATLVGRPVTGGKAAALGTYAVLAASTALLVFAFEGGICIIMALPITLPLGALGGWSCYLLHDLSFARPQIAPMLLLPLATFTFDTHAKPEVFEVKTSMVVNASPETVWRHVVSFSGLPEKRDWIFHTGVAYPIRARIDGTGLGAVRRCEFSTGPFIEPITVWDEPHLLAFRVTQSPAPLNEWSPWGKIQPKHLHGYLVSEHGQFELKTLPGDRTLLIGTTWYRHGLWPAQYWRWWSDAIIHRIHMRVLTHVRALSEQRP